MALIKVSDLMVVQKIDGLTNPVVSFTLDDLHKSLEEFDGKVSKSGDVMTGQLEIRMTDADIPPFLITRLPGYDPVLYFSIAESSLVFEDTKESKIQKNNGDLTITVDGVDLLTYGDDGIVTSHVDIDLKGDFGVSGNRIQGLEWPDVTLTTTRKEYQATNVGYVDNEVLKESIERENADIILQNQIDLVKSYLDLFAKFSLQGNYIFDPLVDTHPLPQEKHFTIKSSRNYGHLYGDVEEITIHEEALDVSNNPIVLDLINQGDFIGINPIQPNYPDLVDRSEFGVYQIIDTTDAIEHDAVNRTFTFKVTPLVDFPIGASLANNNTPHKIRIIRSPGDGSLTRFEAEQLFLSRVVEDNAEDHIKFDRGVTLYGRGIGATGSTGPILPHNTIIDVPEIEVYGGLNINTKGTGPITITEVTPSTKSIIVKRGNADAFTVDGYGSLEFGGLGIQELKSLGTPEFNFKHNDNVVCKLRLDPEDATKSVLGLSSNRIIGVEDPINGMDAVNKRYLEDYIPVDEYVHKTKDNVITGDNQIVSPHDDINLHILGATGPDPTGNKGAAIEFIGGGNPGETIAKVVVNNTSRIVDFIEVHLDTNNQIVAEFKGDIIRYTNNSGSPLFVINSSGNPTGGTQNRVKYYGQITDDEDIINKKYGEVNYLSKTDVKVGTTNTLSAGSNATVTVTAPATFSFGIPRGYTGATGAAGSKGNTGATGAGADGSFVESSPKGIKIEKKDGYYTITGG